MYEILIDTGNDTDWRYQRIKKTDNKLMAEEYFTMFSPDRNTFLLEDGKVIRESSKEKESSIMDEWEEEI